MIWRPLKDDDAPRIAASCITFDPYRRLGYRTETLILYLTREDATLERHAIEQDDRLIGILCLRRPWLRGPLIEMLALLPEAQGQGYGGRVIERCKQQAGKNLWATVAAFHEPARRFYARHGFVELCPLPGLIVPGESEILLRCHTGGDRSSLDLSYKIADGALQLTGLRADIVR